MHTPLRDRALSALASLLIVAAGIVAMILGLAAQMTPTQRRETLAAVLLSQERPPDHRPHETPAKAQSTAAKGRPSPPNLHNRATQVVAPPPRIPPLIVPPPVVTAPVAGTGAAAQSGASDHIGPGRGAGGTGNGDGGGGNGDGNGYGDDDALTRPRQIRGRLHFSDLPPDLREAKSGGELKLRYRIGVDGRVSDCRILVSSGRPELDATTCRLITERFRFRPSRNARGEAVPAVMVETHGWYFPLEEEP